MGYSLMFAGEDRTAAKWMLGALPGIKLMNLAAASGHHGTNTAWVVTQARSRLGRGKKKRKTKDELKP